jgi:hypothetical protein
MADLSARINLLSRLLQNDEVDYATFTSSGLNAWAYGHTVVVSSKVK